MSEKILNTRIQLKGDSLQNWTAQNPVLKLNELAIVKIEESDKHALGTGIYFKVGDGTKKFSELGFSGGIDGRVISEAISKNALVATINKTIADAGIASDEAVQALAGRVTSAEGKITTLEGLVGTKSVATQIAEEIAKLSDVYAPKSHTHTKSEITDFSHSHAIADVTGLSDAIADAKRAGTDAAGALETYKAANDTKVTANTNAIAAIKDGTTIDSFADVEAQLDTKQPTGDYATKAEAQGYADAKDAAINAAKTAADNAQSTIDNYKISNDTAVNTIKNSIGTVPADKTVVQMISEAQTAATYDDTEVRGLISDNANAIGALETLVGSEAVATQINNAVSSAKTELKGNDLDTDESTTIAGAKKYADKLNTAMDSRVDALETAVGEGGSVAEKIAAEIQKLDAIVETAAIPEGQDGIHVKVTEVDGKLTAVEAEIEVSNEINAAKSALEAKIGAVTEGKTLADMIADNAAAIEAHKAAVDSKVTTLIGSDTNKSVRTIANEELAAQLLSGKADADFKTLQELATWLENHPEDAAAMNTAIEALQTKVGDSSVQSQITAAINDLKNGDIKSATDRITTLEADTHTHANKALLDTYTQTEANLADAVAKKHSHANKTELDKFESGDKAKLDTAVQSVTAGEGSGLVATKSGTNVSIAIDDTVTFVLNCGSASTNI